MSWLHRPEKFGSKEVSIAKFLLQKQR